MYLTNADIHLIDFENRFFLYEVRTGAFIHLNSRIYTYISSILQGKSKARSLFSSGLIFKPSLLKQTASLLETLLLNKKKYPKGLSKVKPHSGHIGTIMFNVTQVCNMRCIYCYGGDGSYGNMKHMSRKTAAAALAFVVKNNQYKGTTTINFFGGEPLANHRLIDDVCRTAIELEKAYPTLKFSFAMTSNLSIMNEKTRDLIKKYRIRTMMSFDGSEEIQNKMRPLAGQLPSYNNSMRGLELLKTVQNGVRGRITVTHESGNTLEMVTNLINDGKFSVISTTPVTHSNPNVAMSEQDKVEYVKSLETAAIEIIRSKGKSPLKNWGNLTSSIAAIHNREQTHVGCGAGRGLISVDVDGDLYVCHRFVGDITHKLGNVISGFDQSKREHFLNDEVDNHNCNICWARYICGGGCYQDNYIRTSDDHITDQSECNIRRKVIELNMSIYGHEMLNLSENSEVISKGNYISKSGSTSEVESQLANEEQAKYDDIIKFISEKIGIGEISDSINMIETNQKSGIPPSKQIYILKK